MDKIFHGESTFSKFRDILTCGGSISFIAFEKTCHKSEKTFAKIYFATREKYNHQNSLII